MIKKLSSHLLWFCFVTISLLFTSCGTSRYVNSFSDLEIPSKYYLIKDVIDLQGKTVILPYGSVLIFKSGKLKNGEIKGNNTRVYNVYKAFSNVHFSGSWDIPEITTDILAEDDRLGLSNLFKLQNPNIKNSVWIKDGKYLVNANKTRGALTLTSNTTLRVDGDLYLQPETNNDFYNGYYIIHIRDAQNVKIEGKGRLVGDMGKSKVNGEFGHGICIINSDNVSVTGISIESCNGDGIAVSRNCGSVTIYGINIKYFYRNGISVVGGEDVVVKNVKAEYGGVVSPMAAIDIEPNIGDSVGRVRIKNFYTNKCEVGIAGYVAEKSDVSDVMIKDIRIMGASIPIDVKRMNRIVMENIKIDSCENIKYVVRAIGNKSFVIKDFSFDSPSCSAKYPFYIDNEWTEIINSNINCPQIFSFHLKNALLKNCSFKYNSFIWTAQNLLTKNVVAEKCTFNGPLYMRPANVKIEKSTFCNDVETISCSVVFEEASITNETTPGVVFKNNTINGCEKGIIGVQSSVRNSEFTNNRSMAGTSVLYKVYGTNVSVSRNH